MMIQTFLSLSILLLSTSATELLEQYYFANEIEFLAKQAMVLGDYHPSTNDGDEDIERMKFIERSIRLELDYIRRLRKSLKNPDVVLGNINITDTTPKKKTPINNVAEVVIDAISEATWPSIAISSTNSTTTTKAYYDMSTRLNTTTNPNNPDEVYDYDWASVYGFGNMHEEWQCREHAHSQTKPIYTPEMWDMLWKAFVDSTLFPFPTQTNLDESCAEQPFYVNITTDGKGRGNFATRNITKGEQIYNGHPNTVFFLDGNSFYRFITSLPRKVACDVLEWAWQQDLTDSGNVVLCLNLDNAVFFNHGTWDNSNNMEMRESTSITFHAMRDVQKDEELLYDYDHFEFDTYEMDL